MVCEGHSGLDKGVRLARKEVGETDSRIEKLWVVGAVNMEGTESCRARMLKWWVGRQVPLLGWA